MTDGYLLERFVACSDQAAFAELVRRHGPMVLGVCRRAASNEQDAEDAFQATFLVLVRKAASVVPREMVGNWLFGVACRTVRKVNASSARHRAKEKQVMVMPEQFAEPDEDVAELGRLLDQELIRLPEKYRVAIVLCELEGKPRKEVARRLGLAEGTLSSRLATARRLLAKRLTRRGLALTGGAVAVALARNAAGAGVPHSLAVSAAKTAALAAAGRSVAGAVSAQAAAVADGVLKAMLVAKLRAMAIGLLMIVVVLVVTISWRRAPAVGEWPESLSVADGPIQASARPPNRDGMEGPVLVFSRDERGEAHKALLVPQEPVNRNTSREAQVSINLTFTTSPDAPVGELALDQSPAAIPSRPHLALADLADERAVTNRAIGISGRGLHTFFYSGECSDEEFQSFVHDRVRVGRGRYCIRRRSRLLAAERPRAGDTKSLAKQRQRRRIDDC